MNGAKLTGLWKNSSKQGKPYLAGNIGLSKLLVLPNDFKEKDTDPDYVAWIVPHTKNGKDGKDEKEEDITF